MRLVTIKNMVWRWLLRNEPVMAGFDAVAYRKLNVDVAAAGLDPWVHYVRFGRAERRDPNPGFSASGYLYLYPEAAHWPDPWLHYQEKGREAGLEALPELSGGRAFNGNWPTLMLVGHQAGTQLYGAERSFLDLASTFAGFELNLVIVLPSAINTDYVNRLRELCGCLAILPYGWWRRGRGLVEASVAQFESLLKKHGVSAVYVNTSVLDEPLLAARHLGLPVAVHVREMYDSDPDLCGLLNTSPEAMIERLSELIDVPVVNSQCTARALGLNNAFIVPNSLNPSEFENLATPVERGEPLTFGLVSSNLPKKGLNEFVQLAGACQRQHPEWVFRLIGPDNCYIQALRKRQARGKAPANLRFSGYAANARAALKELDVLLNLSLFKESFGRTVLEAMAAGRPVVAYNHGALPELVASGETGYLVNYRDLSALAEAVSELGLDDELRRRMGESGRERAQTYFSGAVRRQALWKVLEAIGIMSDPPGQNSPGG